MVPLTYAAMILLQADGNDRSFVKPDRLGTLEDRLAILVAPAGAAVDPPRRRVISVDGEFNRPGHAMAVGLVII